MTSTPNFTLATTPICITLRSSGALTTDDMYLATGASALRAANG